MSTRQVLLLAGAIIIGSAMFAAGAAVQSVIQSSTVTPTHLTSWTQTGVIQDAGVSTNGNVSTLGITFNGGTPFCISNFRTPNARSQLCMGVSASEAYLRLDSYDGAAELPFYIILNGVSYPFPSGVTPTTPALRVIASGASDSASAADGMLAWESSTASNKTETLYACGAGSKGNLLSVKDQIGTAALYNITVVAGGSDLIDGSATFVIDSAYGGIGLQCDGAGHWLVL